MIKFISHRGNDNHDYRENTLDAILESLNQPYIFGVEFDVRMTKDKKIVVIHDMTISKASNGYGFVKDMTLKDLLKFNFGNKKHQSLITTLEDILKNVNSNKIIMIEIKHESMNYKLIVNKIYKLINKYKKLNIYIGSFNHQLIRYFKMKYKSIKAGLNLLLKSSVDDLDDIDFLCINYRYINKINPKIETFIWTINTNNQLKKIKKYINEKTYIVTDKAFLLKKSE